MIFSFELPVKIDLGYSTLRAGRKKKVSTQIEAIKKKPARASTFAFAREEATIW